MAQIFNFAQDWTFDQYVDGVKKYGPEENNTDDFTAYFIGYMKRSVARFLDKWNRNHNGCLYARGYGWAGDEFADTIREWFSDFYKEAFGQRPHLPMWYYVHPLGLPMQEDAARSFCASPIDEACEEAREVRASL